jgi:hypothetical protein
MSPADASRLQGIYRRESRSLLHYVRQAAPWAGPDKELLATVNRIADEATVALEAFAAVFDANRITPPEAGSFPMAYTDLNFVAVRWLVPKLVAELTAAAGAVERDAGAIADPAAREALRRLADLHRKHLAELAGLTSPAGT